MARFSNYKSTLDFLFSQLPMYQRIGATAYKKDLTNTLKLCHHLGNPQEKIKTIHIAGTNGKGTVSHLIAYGLQKQGLKIGLYTSPHYKDFRERIKINGEFISKKNVTQFINKNLEIIEEVQPSFFEITVAMAFDYFAKEKVDVAVIEVGLGGRLDSTNIISPLLSVITNISFDHMDMLGNTLSKIAKEKAGIIKKNIPVLIGEKQEEVKNVFEKKALSTSSKLIYANQITEILKVEKKGIQKKIELKVKNEIIYLNTTLISPYHEYNIIAAFSALHLLRNDFEVNFKKIEKGFINFANEIKYLGRWQVINQKPLTILDSAHNEAGIKLAMESLSAFDSKKIHFVIGFVKDKDINKIISLFPKEANYYFCKANIPKGLDQDELNSQCETVGLKGKSYKTVSSAFNAAKRKAKQDEVIYVGGSIFITAEVIK